MLLAYSQKMMTNIKNPNVKLENTFANALKATHKAPF